MIIFIIFLITNVASYKYSWTLDKLNTISHIPDFFINYKNNENQKISTNVYVVDSGIIKSKYFYNNIYKSISVYPSNVLKDEIGHGTFVTSQISSKYYGVTKNVNITTIKVFGKPTEPSTSKELYDALKYIREDCKHTTNNCVINLSLGLNDRYSYIDELLENMHNENILIVAAAGNSNTNCNEFTPSHLPFLIIVGSINYLDIKSSFSNYGQCVDIYTYGEIVPGISYNKTAIKSGTSMSAPIITGYIADYWNYYPNLKNKELQEQFLNKFSLNKYGYRIFILKNSYTNDIILISIINLITLILYLIIKYVKTF